MARRTRTRRRVRRRTKSRRPRRRVYRRRRRARRNAPVANPPRRRRRRRRARRRRNPVAANPPRRRRRRRARRNDWPGQPRRHRKAAKLGHRRRRRRYRRNPPRRHYRRNRGASRRSYRLLANPLEAITSAFKEAFSGDTLETVFHTGLGFGGTLVGSRLIYREVITGLGDTAVGRVGTTLVTSILQSALLGYVGGKQLGVRALGGGLLATLWQGLSEAIKDTPAADVIPTLGEGESEEFRKAIEQEVLRELRGGVGHYEEGEEGMSYYLTPAGSQEYLPAAGSEAYLTASEAEEAADAPTGMSAYLTKREVVAAEAGVGDADEFGPEGMPERF